MSRSTSHKHAAGSRASVDTSALPARVASAMIVGYLAGTIPSSRIATGLAGRDDVNLSIDGTRNPGGMNTSHVLGKKWGAAVTFADMGKAAVASRLGRSLAGGLGANVAATSAVVGHCYPPMRRGGKGVAASLGQVAATFPVYLPVDMAVGISTAALPWFRQRTRVAAGLASATWVGCTLLWWRRGLPNPGGVAPTASLPVAALVSSLVIAQRFREEAASVEGFNRADHSAEPQEPSP